jgi:hypothetical protein
MHKSLKPSTLEAGLIAANRETWIASWADVMLHPQPKISQSAVSVFLIVLLMIVVAVALFRRRKRQ